MRGIILEGVTGSGKSRLLCHLQQRLAIERPANTKVILGEHYTERVLEPLREQGALTEDAVLAHLHSLVALLTPLREAKSRSQFAARAGNTTVLVLVERFLGGHVAHMRSADPSRFTMTPERHDAITRLYVATRDAGLRHVFLRLSPAALRERVLSTRRHRGPEWARFLATLGPDDDAVVAYFDQQQRWLLELAAAFAPTTTPVFYDVDGASNDAHYAHIAAELFTRFVAD